MQTQVSKKSRSKATPAATIATGIARGIPSIKTMKKEAVRVLKDTAEEKLGSFANFLPEGMADDAAEYAQQAVRWLRKNPGAATAVAVLSGAAVGALVHQAILGGSKESEI